MKRAYWDKKADYYESDVFSVLKHDREGLVVGKLEKYGAEDKDAGDFGCGIGYFLPSLSSIFQEVFALDLSPKNIARAEEGYAHLPNVTYRTVDLADSEVSLPEVDFGLCVNAIITPSMEHRERILDSVCKHLRPGAHLVLVVPSLESALLAGFRSKEWDIRDGFAPDAAIKAEIHACKKTDNPRLHEGIVLIEDVPTKHYLKEELIIMLQNRGLTTLEIEKIEYPWKTELMFAPRWMKDPFPWDWLFVAQKAE